MFRIYRTLFIFLFLSIVSRVSYGQKDCPTWEWALEIGAQGDLELIKMRGDSIGNMYVLGSFKNTATFDTIVLTPNGTSYFIAKIDTLGQWVWAQQFEINTSLSFNHQHVPVDLYISKTGHLSVVGNFQDTAIFGSITLTTTSTAPYSLFAARFDPSIMQWLWATSTINGTNVFGSSIAADPQGNTYVTGKAITFPSFNNLVRFGTDTLIVDTAMNALAKISPTGSWQWMVPIGNAEGSAYAEAFVNLTTSGDPVVAASLLGNLSFNGTNINLGKNNKNIVVMGISSTGQKLWYSTSQNSDGEVAGPFGLHLDGYNNIYLHGYFKGSKRFGQDTLNSPLQNNLVASLDANGQWRWAKRIEQTTNLPLDRYYRLGMYTRKNGRSFISGSFQGKVKFGNDSLLSNAPRNVYVAKVDSLGNWQWGGMANQDPVLNGIHPKIVGVAATPSERVFTMGHYFATLHFGFNPVVNYGRFLSKLRPDTAITLNMPPDTTLFCAESMVLKPRTSSVAQLYFTWSPAVGLSDSTIRNPIANPRHTTTYTVNATTGNGCSAQATYTITRDTNLRMGTGISFNTSTGNTIFCNNGNLQIFAPTNFASYQWNTGDTTSSIQVPKPGTYFLTAQDSGGCYTHDSIVIRGVAEISSPNLLLCPNDSVSLYVNPTGLNSLMWNNGSSNPQIYVDQPGKFWVTVTKGSCTYTDTVLVTVFNDTSNATFTYNTNGLAVSFTPNSIGIAKGVWFFGDGNFANSINATHTYSAPGTYQVCYEATDVCGNKATECDSIMVGFVGLEEVEKPIAFSVFPNPTNGMLNIESDQVDTPVLRIIDLSGKILVRHLLPKNSRWTIELHHLPQGYYFMRIDNYTTTFVKN